MKFYDLDQPLSLKSIFSAGEKSGLSTHRGSRLTGGGGHDWPQEIALGRLPGAVPAAVRGVC